MGIATAAILAAAIHYSIIRSRPLVRALVRDFHPTAAPLLLFSALESGLAIGALSLHAPLLCLYALIYLCKCIGLRLAAGSFSSRLWLCANLVCLHLAMAHLFSLAVLSLWLGRNPFLVYNDPFWGTVSVFAALGIVFTICATLQHFVNLEHLQALAGMAGRQREVDCFSWFALGYIVFDSVPCMFDLPYALVSWFLLGSCLLLWAQLYFLLGYAYKIFVRQHIEHECRLLEQQQAQHLNRTLALRKNTLRDTLTGAYTREHVLRVLRRWLAGQKKFALAYIDLNGLKLVNDRWGHETGDAYLAAAVAIMKRHLRSKGLLARIGGDEFLALLHGADADQARALMETAARELEAGKARHPRSLSFGVEAVTADGNLNAEALIQRADLYMYEDKKRRKTAAATGGR